MRAVPALVVLVAVLSFAAEARAHRRTRLASDGLYLGARIGPGIAPLAAWDLDVYLSPPHVASIGPAVSIAMLASEPAAPGMRQTLLLTVDVFRFKLGLAPPRSQVRPFVSLGAGFMYAQLPEQSRAN